MELLQLYYFQKVANNQHISKTANELNISQPSLSQSIRKLEIEIGTDLFDRNGKNITLNQAGHIYLKYVNDVFNSLKNASLEINNLMDKEEKVISIAVLAGSTLLPLYLKEIQNMDAEINFNITQDIPNDDVDFIINASSIKPNSPHKTILLEEDLVVAIPHKHPMANKKISLHDLVNEKLISLTKDNNLCQILEHYFNIYNFHPRNEITIDSPHIMRELLRINAGISIIPKKSWQDVRLNNINLIEFNETPMKRYIFLEENHKKYKSQTISKCKEIIINFFNYYFNY